VINQHLAAELFDDQSPLGRTVLVGERREPAEVIGVAPNALYDGPLHDERPRYLFLAQQQATGDPPLDPTFYIRHHGSLESASAAASQALKSVDASVPIVTMSTMNARLQSVTVLERMIARLLMVFAVASLIVAALGQYGVAMFNMRRRTKDFGVRMAIGASAAQVQREVIGEALRLTWQGLAVGFVLSVAVGVAARGVLFGVTPTDPATYLAVFAVLSAASIAASYLPAWRAARINVVDALRQE
jgi:ABC-type antimicrobial peptide transport system permease subunit